MKPTKMLRVRRAAALALPAVLLSLAAAALVPGDAAAPAFSVSVGPGKSQAVVARSANGGFVLVWRGDDGDQGGIFARLYDAQGRPRGAEFAINNTTLSVQKDPAVAINASGEFVVAWASQSVTTGSAEIIARHYAADGNPITGEVQANLATDGFQAAPAVGIAGNGDYLVAWQNFSNASSNDIFARRFSAAGAAQTGDLAVNETLPDSQENAAVSLAANGSGVIAWTSYSQDAGGSGVFQRRISAAGAFLTGETVLNTANSPLLESRPSVSLAADGSLCAAWQAQFVDDIQIALRRFAADGTPVGAEVAASSGADIKSFAHVAADADGDCLLQYSAEDGDVADALYVRLFDKNQMPLTDQLSFSTAALLGGIGADADGDAVVGWIENGAVLARRVVGPELVDLSATLTANSSSASPGGTVRYTASVNNLHSPDAGNAAIGRADSVSLVAPTPAGTSRRIFTADAGWDCAATTAAQLSCSRREALAAGASASLSYELVMPSQSATVTATTAVAGLQADTASANNSASRDVAVRAPTIQFTALTTAQARLSEASSGQTLQVTVSPPAGSELSVPVSLSGSASASDYSLSPSGRLTIPAGAATASITVTPVNDSNDEDDETLTLTLGATDGVSLGDPVSQTLTILDDDASPSIAFATSRVTAAENGGNIETIVRLSAASSRDVQVAFTGSGTATLGSDYTLNASSPLTIAAGATEARILITVIDDSLDEANEELLLSLSAPVNASLGSPASFTASLTDNDTRPNLGFDNVSGSVREGSTTSLLLRLSALSGRDISGSLTLAGEASQTSDYTVSATQFSIPAGSETAEITVQALSDNLDEADETLSLTLANLVNADPRGGAAQANLSLVDTNLPAARFALASSSVQESAGTMSLSVTLSSPTDRDLSLSFSRSGEADSSDAVISASPLRIPAGASEGSITVSISNDSADEDDERLILSLGTGSGYTLASPADQVLSIIDDDSQPRLRFASGNLALTEGGAVDVPVLLSAISGKTVTARISVTGGSAASNDYSLSTDTLTFAPGDTEGSLRLTTVTDTRSEGDETLNLAISSPGNAGLATPSSLAVTISDPGGSAPVPVVSFSQAASSAQESAGAVSIAVNLSSPADRLLEIAFSKSGEADGSDALLSSSPLRIPAGASSGIISVNISNDSADEDDERLVLALSPGTGYTLASPVEHVLSIQDDDSPPRLRFAANTLSVVEGSSVDVPVLLSAASGKPISVRISVGGGTAGLDDYSISSSTASFAAGETETTVRLTATTDSRSEGDETLGLQLGSPVNASLSTPSALGAVISDPGASSSSSSSGGTTSGGILNGGDGGSGGGALGWLSLLPLLLAGLRRHARR